MGTYHGGKVRLGLEISQIISKSLVGGSEKEGAKEGPVGYCEPFCGFCGVYRHIPGIFEEELGYTYEDNFDYLAGDDNGSVIKMWKGLQGNWKPPTGCCKVRFDELKRNGRESAEKGLIGHACGYRGLYFSTFFDKNSIQRTAPLLKGLAKGSLADVKFTPGSYTQFSHLKGYIIYCDPPYKSRSNYYDENHKLKKFDRESFIDWCRAMKRNGNLVIVSEGSGGLLPWREIQLRNGKESLYYV